MVQSIETKELGTKISKWTRAFLGPLKTLTLSKQGTIGFLLVLAFVITAVFAPFLRPYDPNGQLFPLLERPSLWHPFGTDSLGRDVLSRSIYGTKIALIYAFGASGLALVIGVVLGAIAGYYGGLIDDTLSRIFEIFLMLPAFFLIILVVAIYGAKVTHATIIIAVTMWPSNARITRAQVLTLRTRAYVEAATISGVGTIRILLRHILPNGIQPVIVNTAFQMATAVLLEASLAFLGLSDPNAISWGGILWDAQSNWTSWWLIIPGGLITLLCLGFSLLADGINYAFNPRFRGRRLR